MKEYLAERVRAASSPAQGRNVAREYLQARLLGALQRGGAMMPLAFHGGTALRFLHGIPRYSEDLDFALEGDASQYDLRACLKIVQAELGAEGYEVGLKVNDRRIVHSAFVRFVGLLHELGLSPHAGEGLAIKVEVDTRPPAGAVLETSLVRRHLTLRLQHHDRASLLAGKVHALLHRPYAKGRDLFDLLWYLSDPDWPAPNLELLGNALRQTEWKGECPTEHNWRFMVWQKVQTLSWERVVDDVRPFLESGEDIGLLTLENLGKVLRVLPPV